MIVCPRCSHENEDSAMNCASCRINLQWALENPQEAAQRDLQSAGRPVPEVRAENRVVRGLLFIVLLLAVPASGILAFLNLLNVSMTPEHARARHGGYIGAWFWAVVMVVCIFAAIAALLPRRVRPRYYRGLRILALIALGCGLLYGLMRLTLVILPEHSGQSLIIQYKLGERDFSGVELEGADLSGANLREANLSTADLSEASLSGAYLYRTDLSGADLRGADLTGAYLHRTILRGADLSGAAVTDEQLDRAWNLVGTILPDGSVHE